jgi:ABC-type branched-subunit amino acid transport system substrate-binding protein
MERKMTVPMGNKRRSLAVWLLAGWCVWVIFPLDGVRKAYGQQPGAAGLSSDEVRRLGEGIYRDGMLPSGGPVKAVVEGDLAVEGTQFSCSSCHMRGGFGSYEGRLITPPVNGNSLYQPRYGGGLSGLSQAEWERVPKHYRSTILRPAYTDQTLAAAIRDGVNPAGRVLDAVMPRYQLGERDLAVLIAYLKGLSSAFEPGVTDTTLRFATVIAGEVKPAERAAMLAPLERYLEDRNNQAKPFETRRNNYGWGAEGMDRDFRRLSLARWELKGAPETWRVQLEDLYRKEPVFALLGGISSGDWKPIHEFSEAHRIPCILPVTDFPVISENDWYTLYFSKGLYQEGEAAARFLFDTADSARDRPVLEIVEESREGRALAAGFDKTWQSLGGKAPATRRIKAGEALPPGLLKELAAYDKPPVIVLWAGPRAVAGLEELYGRTERPEMIYLSSSMMKQSLMKLPASLRDFTYLSYPYRLPDEKDRYSAYAKAWLVSRKVPLDESRIATRMYSLMSLITPMLMHLKRNFYRDNLLDVISMFPDQLSPDYERLSFGPGQQYASKGCYIVQLTQGSNPRLVKKSGWVIN